MYGGSLAGIRGDAAGTRNVCKSFAKGVLSVLLAQVLPPPNAGSDPDPRDGDNDDDEEDDPLVMSRQPR